MAALVAVMLQLPAPAFAVRILPTMPQIAALLLEYVTPPAPAPPVLPKLVVPLKLTLVCAAVAVNVGCAILAIVMLKLCVAAVPTPLLALMLPVYVPPAVGVPVIAPLVASSISPAGKLPDAKAYVGAGLPLATTV